MPEEKFPHSQSRSSWRWRCKESVGATGKTAMTERGADDHGRFTGVRRKKEGLALGVIKSTECAHFQGGDLRRGGPRRPLKDWNHQRERNSENDQGKKLLHYGSLLQNQRHHHYTKKDFRARSGKKRKISTVPDIMRQNQEEEKNRICLYFGSKASTVRMRKEEKKGTQEGGQSHPTYPIVQRLTKLPSVRKGEKKRKTTTTC